MKTRDPQTVQIPIGIHARELSFVSGMPMYPEGMGQSCNWRALFSCCVPDRTTAYFSSA
ncbi:MAG: hypothetical protein NTV01_16595 [Bacteroidia bacterium]|nr:hypothetical protein [Bacteroidia bacterium]